MMLVRRLVRDRNQFRRTDLSAIISLILLTATGIGRTLPSYFLSDDFILLRHAESFHGSVRPLFTTGGGDGFFRPVGYLSLAFTNAWAGSRPLPWHIVALGLHTANVVLVAMLALFLGRSRRAAFFTAALFAIHGTRPEVAVWVAGRFDLLATFFVLCGLLFFIRSDAENGPIGYLYASSSIACMAAGILTKESAFIFPILLIMSMFLAGTLSWRRIVGLIPFFFVASALFVYRSTLLGGIGGYRNPQSGQPQVLTLGIVHVIKALLLRIWAVLFFPINWSREPSTLFAILLIAYLVALACL